MEFQEQTSIDAIFGRIVAALRAELGLAQRPFRQIAGMRPGALERLERGVSSATVAHVFEVTLALRRGEPGGNAARPDALDVSPWKLVALLTQCRKELRQQRVLVYLEDPPAEALPELELRRLDRLIAPVIERFLQNVPDYRWDFD